MSVPNAQTISLAIFTLPGRPVGSHEAACGSARWPKTRSRIVAANGPVGSQPIPGAGPGWLQSKIEASACAEFDRGLGCARHAAQSRDAQFGTAMGFTWLGSSQSAGALQSVQFTLGRSSA